jgi:SAM-dependent methyltransferase
VHEILSRLDGRAWVLDVGSGAGSFPAGATRARVVRVDAERPGAAPGNFVLGDAARLPFPDDWFDAIVSNHSLEHITDLEGAVREMRRVVRGDGYVYIAVPDATTLADRVYRWLGRGGGHVNAFVSAEDVPRLFGAWKPAATRVLYASFSFLNRRNFRARAPRRLMLLGNGSEGLLRVGTWVLRKLDEALGTRWSVYGWAYYFGEFPEGAPATEAARNVCVRCGSGHAAAWLEARGVVERRWFGAARFVCPGCGARNYFVGR